jgi:hypothetical protein
LVKGIVILCEAKHLWFDGRGSGDIATWGVSLRQNDNDKLARFNSSTT